MISLKEILTDKNNYDIVCSNSAEANCLMTVLRIITKKIPCPRFAVKWFKQYKKLNIDKHITFAAIANKDLSDEYIGTEPKSWWHITIDKPKPYYDNEPLIIVSYIRYNDIKELKERESDDTD